MHAADRVERCVKHPPRIWLRAIRRIVRGFPWGAKPSLAGIGWFWCRKLPVTERLPASLPSQRELRRPCRDYPDPGERLGGMSAAVTASAATARLPLFWAGLGLVSGTT